MNRRNLRNSVRVVRPQSERQREKTVYVLLIESESRETIDRATKQLSGIGGVNYMQYTLGDSYLRMVFSALRQAVVSSK